jgi:hypothetical protein
MAFGLLGALALHLNPSSVFILIGWVLWSKPGRRWLGVAAGALMLASLPWAIRNYSVFGQPIFIRNNLGLELRVSNNDVARARFHQNAPSFLLYHPNDSAAVAAMVAAQGEGAFMRRQAALALDWIRAHPGRFTGLTLQRFRYYWFPAMDSRPWQGWLISLLTLLSLPAALRLRRHPMFAVPFLLAPVLYYFVQADPRYRYPYLWLTLLAAGVTMNGIMERWKQSREPDSDPA